MICILPAWNEAITSASAGVVDVDIIFLIGKNYMS